MTRYKMFHAFFSVYIAATLNSAYSNDEHNDQPSSKKDEEKVVAVKVHLQGKMSSKVPVFALFDSNKKQYSIVCEAMNPETDKDRKSRCYQLYKQYRLHFSSMNQRVLKNEFLASEYNESNSILRIATNKIYSLFYSYPVEFSSLRKVLLSAVSDRSQVANGETSDASHQARFKHNSPESKKSVDRIKVRSCQSSTSDNNSGEDSQNTCEPWYDIPREKTDIAGLQQNTTDLADEIPNKNFLNNYRAIVPLGISIATFLATGGAYLNIKLSQRIYYDYTITNNEDKSVYKVRFQVPSWPEISPGQLLDRDIMLKAFTDRGFIVNMVKRPKDEKVDLNIHLEYSGKTSNGYENWMLVNQEFFDAGSSKGMDKYFCRHQDCSTLVLSSLGDVKVKTIKFSSKAKAQKFENLDFGKFFHPAGKSPMKNTNLVIKTWLKNPYFPPLVVTCYNVLPVWGCLYNLKVSGLYSRALKAENITIHTSRLSNEDFAEVSKIGIVVMPSKAEGFGHSINEARGKGQLVLTVDADPMDSFVEDGVSGFKISAKMAGTFSSGAPMYSFDTGELAKKIVEIQQFVEADKSLVKLMSSRARQSFEADAIKFQTSFIQELKNSISRNWQKR